MRKSRQAKGIRKERVSPRFNTSRPGVDDNTRPKKQTTIHLISRGGAFVVGRAGRGAAAAGRPEGKNGWLGQKATEGGHILFRRRVWVAIP